MGAVRQDVGPHLIIGMTLRYICDVCDTIEYELWSQLLIQPGSPLIPLGARFGSTSLGLVFSYCLGLVWVPTE